jgi:hypothetical protein
MHKMYINPIQLPTPLPDIGNKLYPITKNAKLIPIIYKCTWKCNKRLIFKCN